MFRHGCWAAGGAAGRLFFLKEKESEVGVFVHVSKGKSGDLHEFCCQSFWTVVVPKNMKKLGMLQKAAGVSQQRPRQAGLLRLFTKLVKSFDTAKGRLSKASGSFEILETWMKNGKHTDHFSNQVHQPTDLPPFDFPSP